MAENISNINYLDNIELMPVNTGISLRSKKEVLDKLIIDYTLASVAMYAICSSFDLVNKFLDSMDKKFEISKILTNKDKQLILDIYNKKLDKSSLNEITYRFESANTCMWALGLSNNITYENKCSVKVINDLLLKVDKYDSLLNGCELRSLSEILNYYSVIAKILNSNIKVSKLTEYIIDNQDSSIRYIVLYNFNKYGFKARYFKEDLKFEFELPEGLKFENMKTDVLFALTGNNNLKLLAQEIKDDRIQNNLKKLKDNGFEIIDINYGRSLYLDKRLLKVRMKKENIMVYTYYLYIKTHLLRIDYSYDRIDVASDIIYSIKTFE